MTSSYGTSKRKPNKESGSRPSNAPNYPPNITVALTPLTRETHHGTTHQTWRISINTRLVGELRARISPAGRHDRWAAREWGGQWLGPHPTRRAALDALTRSNPRFTSPPQGRSNP